MRTYPEPMVSRVIGVAKPRLAVHRKLRLTREEDWVLDNAVVAYTEAGLKKMLEVLGLSGAVFDWPSSGSGGNPPAAFAARIEAIDGAGGAVETSSMLEKIHESVERLEAADDARPRVKLTVSRVSRNPTIVYGVTLEGEEVPVKVANNVNFIPEMVLEARPEGNVYYFEGRCPRWRGRW